MPQSRFRARGMCVLDGIVPKLKIFPCNAKHPYPVSERYGLKGCLMNWSEYLLPQGSPGVTGITNERSVGDDDDGWEGDWKESWRCRLNFNHNQHGRIESNCPSQN
jgi:hypothetical protein